VYDSAGETIAEEIISLCDDDLVWRSRVEVLTLTGTVETFDVVDGINVDVVVFWNERL
jgi:hypothetical protein